MVEEVEPIHFRVGCSIPGSSCPHVKVSLNEIASNGATSCLRVRAGVRACVCVFVLVCVRLCVGMNKKKKQK